MSIKRIRVQFVGSDGVAVASATGAVDRRIELIRQARAELEEFKTAARRAGDPAGDAHYELEIEDAPAAARWVPKG